MVSKARLDLPEPERPVTTMSLSRGISTETFLRLCTRAPCTAMVVRIALPMALAALLAIGFPQVDKRQLLHHKIAPLGELDGRRGFADKPPIGQVFACRSHAFHIEAPLEMRLDLGGGPSF